MKIQDTNIQNQRVIKLKAEESELLFLLQSNAYGLLFIHFCMHNKKKNLR